MKNLYLKKSLIGILSLSLLCPAVSCQGKNKGGTANNNGNSQNEEININQVAETSYSSIDFDAEIPFDYLDSMIFAEQANQFFIIAGDAERQSVIYCTDTEFSSFKEIPVETKTVENGENYLRTAVTSDGTIYIASTCIDYGDFKMPDYDDPNFDSDSFDFDAMYKSAKYSCTLYKIDSSGNLISENEITGMENYSDDEEENAIYIRNIFPCSDDKIIISISGGDEDIYLIADSDGKITGKIDLGDINWINSSCEDSNGNIACLCYKNEGYSISYIDPDSKKFTDSGIELTDELTNQGVISIIKGTGDYSMFLNTSTSLYGVDKDNNVKEVINWIDSDINGNCVSSIASMSDGDFIAYIRDYENGINTFTTLTKRDVSELENTVFITLGVMYSDSSITSKVTAFNKENTGYRIKISDYSKYDDYDTETGTFNNSSSEQLKKDIVAGNAPDMICVYDTDIISSLSSKDIYTDLYTFLESDTDVKKDDIMPNVLKANEYGGKLLSLSPSFAVQTLACKSKFCDKENWTFDDLVETYEKLPKDSSLMPDATKESVFGNLIYASHEFIDYEKGKCSFDSDEFIKLLEFCNQFPDEDDAFDWENATQDEIQSHMNEKDLVYLKDKALLCNLYMSNFRDYTRTQQAHFNDDITLVGYPSSDGKGAVILFDTNFAILDSSESKEGCWEFVKTFFTEDYQSGEKSAIYSFPSRKTAFEKKAEESTKRPYYFDENNKKVEYDDTYYIKDKEVKIKPLTEKEKNILSEYISNVSSRSNSYSKEAGEIMDNEVKKYFKGECSAEDAGKMIQNRLSIMISEQS